jgi:hypothetical protein
MRLQQEIDGSSEATYGENYKNDQMHRSETFGARAKSESLCGSSDGAGWRFLKENGT